MHLIQNGDNHLVKTVIVISQNGTKSFNQIGDNEWSDGLGLSQFWHITVLVFAVPTSRCYDRYPHDQVLRQVRSK